MTRATQQGTNSKHRCITEGFSVIIRSPDGVCIPPYKGTTTAAGYDARKNRQRHPMASHVFYTRDPPKGRAAAPIGLRVLHTQPDTVADHRSWETVPTPPPRQDMPNPEEGLGEAKLGAAPDKDQPRPSP